ncbi:MAG: tetratricopeptide repeat protein [Planctomycetia bacterium]|nr:tetratricopeptide repeat protein [Planctomycetia bacterium]
MPIANVPEFVAEIKRLQLLDPAQLQALTAELAPRSSEPRALARDLLQRGWLTTLQINRLFQGRGGDLALGSYTLLEVLGEGGMGAVYKARHRRLDRTDAVKVIRKEFLANPNAVQRFQREAKAAARLSHPNVITVYDAGEAGDVHFLAMEFVPGTDLSRLVKQQGPLPAAVACEYIRQAALGLAHVHARGLIHRDIKPSNLLLTADGATIKLLDLGLARSMGLGAEEAGLTETGSVVGTADYIAPEQARNSHQVDIRADLYSLGCTLYFLLAGKIPFTGETLAEKLIKHQLEEAPPLAGIRHDLPPGLTAVVQQLMAKNPNDRYQVPVEVAAALTPFTGALVTAESITAKPGGAAPLAVFSGSQSAVPLALPLGAPGEVSASLPATLQIRRAGPSLSFRVLLLLIAVGTGALLLLVTAVGLWYFVGNRPQTVAVAPPTTTRPRPTTAKNDNDPPPHLAQVHLDRGNAHLDAKRYDEAIAEFTTALKHSPRDAGIFCNRALAHQGKGDSLRALADLASAMQHKPDLSTPYVIRAGIYYGQGDLDRSLADNTKALQLNPRDAVTWNNRGTLYSRQGRHDQALADYDEAIRLNPKYVGAYNNRGNVWLDKNEPAKAVGDFSEAIRLEPNNALSHEYRGQAHHRNGDGLAAIADFNRAIQLNPKLAIAFFHRAQAQEKLGRQPEAKADYERAFQLDPRLKTPGKSVPPG